MTQSMGLQMEAKKPPRWQRVFRNLVTQKKQIHIGQEGIQSSPPSIPASNGVLIREIGFEPTREIEPLESIDERILNPRSPVHHEAQNLELKTASCVVVEAPLPSPPLKTFVPGERLCLPISNIPHDIWILILSYITKSGWIIVAQTSSHLRDILMPLLYNNISLNLHNTPLSQSRHPFRNLTALSQHLLIRSVLASPYLAKYVRSLTWTTGLENMGLLPHTHLGQRVIWNRNVHLEFFGLLDNIVSVDIDTGDRQDAPNFRCSSLFPAAQHIRLGGRMNYSFATAILHGEGKAKLHSLVLNNIQQCRKVMGSKSEADVPGGYRKEYDLVTSMTGLLNSKISDRCRDLHALSIVVGPGPGFERACREYSVFLAHEVHPKRMKFEVLGGLQRTERGYGEQGRVLGSKIELLMDGKFREALLPVLKQGWYGLERLEIKGLGGDVTAPLVSLADAGVQVILEQGLQNISCVLKRESYRR